LNREAPSAGWSGGRGFLVFKGVVYGLLLFNTALLIGYASWREALEQGGWLMILAAFEWESRGLDDRRGRFAVPVALEGLGYAVAIFCWGAYAVAGEWLDFANASLWLLVVAAIAGDLHWQQHYGRTGRRLRVLLKGVLYVALLGVALIWGLQGAWLDAWDAVIWLLCFFVIELKLFDFRPAPSAVSSAG
jgi:hypothetical protein